MPDKEFVQLKKTFTLLLEKFKLIEEQGGSTLELNKKLNFALHKIAENLDDVDFDETLLEREPNDLESIKKLRPAAKFKYQNKISKKDYRKKLEGAFIGRMAGCTLGAPVELWDISKMEMLASENNQKFPPIEYWNYIPFMNDKRYKISKMSEYTKDGMHGVPVDDDIVYTILNLLLLEEHGLNFNTDDVSQIWLKYLPYACTAEEVALDNLKRGAKWQKAGEKGNPYIEWIGAAIRADTFGYVFPGNPEAAAERGYKDAYLSHRRNGIYGEMFWAAVISAAFIVDDPIDAIKIGLAEIPRECRLALAIEWTLNNLEKVKDYKSARAILDEKFPQMSMVHTINNACATIFGLWIGKNNFTKTIGETVAIGLDNDCNAATAGSVVGAIIGIDKIESSWYKNFNDKARTYLIDKDEFIISDLLNRLEEIAFHN